MACVFKQKTSDKKFFKLFRFLPPEKKKSVNCLYTTFISFPFKVKKKQTLPTVMSSRLLLDRKLKKRKLNHDNVAPPSHSSYFFYSCIHTHQNNPPPQNKETHKHTGFIVVLHHWNSNEIFEFFFDSVCVCVCLNKSIRF